MQIDVDLHQSTRKAFMGNTKIKPEDLLSLLDTYLEGSASSQEKEIVDSWFDQHSLDSLNTGKKEVEKRIWQTIQNRIHNSNK